MLTHDVMNLLRWTAAFTLINVLITIIGVRMIVRLRWELEKHTNKTTE